MSLQYRIERAKSGSEDADGQGPAHAGVPFAPARSQVASRQQLLRDIRMQMQSVISSASSSLLEPGATNISEQIEDLLDRFLVSND